MTNRLFESLFSKLFKRDDFPDQFRRYRQTFFWLLVSLWKANRKKCALTTLANITGVILHTGTLSALLYYGSLMESDSSIDLYRVSYPARNETLFFGILTISGIILIAGSWFKYFGARSNSELCVQFSTYCSKQILLRPWIVIDGPLQCGLNRYPAELLKLMTGIKQLSRGAKPILNLASPLTTMFYSLGILLYQEPLLTLVLIAVISPTLILQYIINYQATQNEKVLVSTARQTNNEITEVVSAASEQNPGNSEFKANLDAAFRNPTIQQHLDAYIFRLVATNKSGLVSDILLALLAIGVMTFLGGRALAGEISWITFLTYLLFARISLSAIRGILSTVTGFARHYGRVRDIYYVVNGTMDRPPPRQQNSAMLKFDESNELEELCVGKQTVYPDHLIPVLSPTPLTRLNLCFFSYAIGQAVGKTSRLLYQSAYSGNYTDQTGNNISEDSKYRQAMSHLKAHSNSLSNTSKSMLEYISSDQYCYNFLDSGQVTSTVQSTHMNHLTPKSGENIFWFVCGQSLSDFDSFDESDTALIIRPDGKLIACNLKTIRQHQRQISKWLVNWIKRNIISDDSSDDE